MLQEIESESTQRLAGAIFCYSFAASLLSIFLPAYYLQVGFGKISWVVEYLATEFLVLGLVPTLTLRYFHKHFEKLICVGFLLYSLYNLSLILSHNQFLIGAIAGLALGTFWPSFNTLQLRLTSNRDRNATINVISILIMTISSTLGPLAGGIMISAGGGFSNAILTSAVFYLAAIYLMRRFEFKETGLPPKFESDEARTLRLFGIGSILTGLSDGTWFVYPIFALSLVGSYQSLGLVASCSSLVIALASVALGRFSDRNGSRFQFILIGLMLCSAWYFILPLIGTQLELVAAAAMFGLSGSFLSSNLAWMGDSFHPDLYPSILTKMEIYLMIGRLSNLALVLYFMQDRSYFGYFMVSGLTLSFSSIVYYILERSLNKQKRLREYPELLPRTKES